MRLSRADLFEENRRQVEQVQTPILGGIGDIFNPSSKTMTNIDPLTLIESAIADTETELGKLDQARALAAGSQEIAKKLEDDIAALHANTGDLEQRVRAPRLTNAKSLLELEHSDLAGFNREVDRQSDRAAQFSGRATALLQELHAVVLAGRKADIEETIQWKEGTSRFKGVHWYEPRNQWEAKICAHGRRVHLGYFTDPREAAIAYNAAAKCLHGRFAFQNRLSSQWVHIPNAQSPGMDVLNETLHDALS